MPYRRLPNTNQARLRSLKSAVRMGEIMGLYELAFSYKTFEEAKGFLVRYERALFEYKQSSENQINTNKRYQSTIKNARIGQKPHLLHKNKFIRDYLTTQCGFKKICDDIIKMTEIA